MGATSDRQRIYFAPRVRGHTNSDTQGIRMAWPFGAFGL